ncbi:hypothetical protein A3H03_03115 [Candidatus Kuenenbacteria bacterium RIFCSPLOWO2_12_FULL_42_13]|uniref:CBM11 domain-containing protein n=4 Tax=Candidatus Kueneniibacteriota TaxID=1752740 RepID=A0A1F6G2J0_9BACT|nr:MAG: hypothetical protein A3H55_03785 [Candidatus Kuenenbacteria bacterium RIFCSPLOWO2_02_FULL_42_16]OGG92315.1 MAG: hypothetical protein A3H03_03115 [Candidatus Kuenenbacteria bacterium RIFCSPLOWO2_12_FULL_42_13]OGG95675.1 MAG: hypothetical protein A2V95_01270 [Candidatus Kuenenbacteria bacterium RBG_16_41_7]
MRAYKIIKIILILIPIIILAVLVYKDFNPSGYLKVGYDFCREEPFISKFSPLGRVLAVERINGACSQKMVIDPVYFDVRLPQRFNEVRLTIWYKKLSETKLQIGPAIDLSAWQWQLKDINYIRNEGNWQIGQTSYDLFLTQIDHNRLRFLVSSPNLADSGQEVIFKKIELEFVKKPIQNWADVIERLRDLILFSRLKFIIHLISNI